MKIRPWVKTFLLIILIAGIAVGSYKYLFKDKDDNIVSKDGKTLNAIKETNLYQEKYDKEYEKINYIEKEDFIENIALFLDKGYNAEEINDIYSLSDKNIAKLKLMQKTNFKEYKGIKNFDIAKIDRYNNYKKDNNKLTLNDVVTYVNIGLDLKPYEITNEVNDPNDLLVLVNKFNGLPLNYKPADLAYLDGQYGNKVPVRKIAADAFLELRAKGIKDGITLNPTTAFRDSNFQKTLYNNYVNKDGKVAADTYSARPGFSEHQAGLSIDLKNPDTPSNIRLTENDYTWLKENCADFGFIVRFPGDKEHVTLYQEENWHIRYVGKDAAKIIMDNKLTLEEYIDLYITEY